MTEYQWSGNLIGSLSFPHKLVFKIRRPPDCLVSINGILVFHKSSMIPFSLSVLPSPMHHPSMLILCPLGPVHLSLGLYLFATIFVVDLFPFLDSGCGLSLRHFVTVVWARH